MKQHQHPEEIMKQICDQMGEDLNAPVCREVAVHLQECPECKFYFDTVKKTVVLCREIENKKSIPPEVRQRLMKLLLLNKDAQ